MADEKEGTTPEGAPAEAGKGGKITLILIAVIGLVLGSTLGFSKGGDVVGPILAARAQSSEASGGGGHGGGHGGGDEPSPIHVVENLVVNPARSGGTRFLLTSIAIEAPTPELAEALNAHDWEIRAALILVLGSMSTEHLSDIANRPAIIEALHASVADVMGDGAVKHVFIPQFVIQ